MFPLIPLLALASILGGAGTLRWYSCLGKECREKADRLAAEYARDLFGKRLSQLTRAEANRVHALAKRDFVN